MEVRKITRKTKKTGVTYEDIMGQFENLWFKYQECPDRFLKTIEKCKDWKLLEQCVRIPSRKADHQEIAKLHEPSYIDIIKKSQTITDHEELKELSLKFDSTYFHPNTYEAALYSVGCAIDLVTAIVKDEVQNGMAIIRPPGHHALNNEACGYCFFNNVALAAKHAVDNLGLNRILIIDWDIHHGQATQYMFYDDPKVLYFSIHRYQHGYFWPELRESNYDYIGKDKGIGYNFNVPLNKIGMENLDYMAIWNNILLPIAYEYSPELVLISAGFDSALGCPEGEMRIAPQFYSQLLKPLMGLANGNIAVILEGGYCVSSLSQSAAVCLRTLLGYPCIPYTIPKDKPKRLNETLDNSILDVISVQRPFWKSLQFQDVHQLFLNGSLPEPPFHLPKLHYKGKLSFLKPDSFIFENAKPIAYEKTQVQIELELLELEAQKYLNLPVKNAKLVTVINSEEGLTEIEYALNYSKFKMIQPSADTELQKFDQKKCLSNCSNLLTDASNLLVVLSSVQGLQDLLFSFCKEVATKHKKILIIDFGFTSNRQLSTSKIDETLLISIMPTQQKNSTEYERENFIKLCWDKGIIETGGIKDGDLIGIILNLILPISYEFNPDLVLIGWDAVQESTELKWGRPNSACFAHLINLFTPLANGKVVVFMEGRNNKEILGQDIKLASSALLGEPIPSLPHNTFPSNQAIQMTRDIYNKLSPKYPTLKFQKTIVEKSDGIKDNLLELNEKRRAEIKLTKKIIDVCKHCPISLDHLVEKSASSLTIVEKEKIFKKFFCQQCNRGHSFNLDHDYSIEEHLALGIKSSSDEELGLCLTCNLAFCKSYQNNHQNGLHNKDHHVFLSINDFSCWCNACDAYIENWAYFESFKYYLMDNLVVDMSDIELRYKNLQ